VCAQSIPTYDPHREMEIRNIATLDRAQIPTVRVVSERHVENAEGEIPYVVLLHISLSLLVFLNLLLHYEKWCPSLIPDCGLRGPRRVIN
jgi:hypothetical protein